MQEVDLQSTPLPHFLRQAELIDGESAVGVVIFDPDYPAIASRGGRVNASEAQHSLWNLAHWMTGQGLIGPVKNLRACEIDGRFSEEMFSGKDYRISARLIGKPRSINGTMWGKIEAEINDESRNQVAKWKVFFAAW